MEDKYVFIDRDGVINKDGYGWTEEGYIIRWEDFHFLPGVLQAFKMAAEAGYQCIVISNQQCVGKGILSEQGLNDLTDKMIAEVRRAGGDIAGVFYCTHRAEELCYCRKPRTGLFLKAQRELGIKDMTGKFFIGDAESDMRSGALAGLSTILVLSGRSETGQIDSWECKPDYVSADLLGAVEIVTGRGK